MILARTYKAIILVLVLGLLLLSVEAYAETKEIIAEGVYIMGDGETPGVAQERAIIDAKQQAVEQAGTFLESYSVVKDMQLVKDEVRVVAAEVIEVTVIDKKREVINGGEIRFWVKIRCMLNTDNLQAVRTRLKDQEELNKLKEIQADYSRLAQQNAQLKTMLAQATSNKTREQLQAEIAQNEKEFTAVQWLEKGNEYYIKQKDYDKAIAAFTQSIVLNPEYAGAYNNRSATYVDRGHYDLAMNDLNKAISLNPQYAQAYYNRGVIMGRKGRYDLAIVDYDRAIVLSHRYISAYYNRGLAHYRLGRYDSAIADFSQTIALNAAINSQEAPPYCNRGSVYMAREQYDLAIIDFDRAIALNPQDFRFHYNKAIACDKVGRRSEAIVAYRQFINLAPQSDYQQVEYAKRRIAALGG